MRPAIPDLIDISWHAVITRRDARTGHSVARPEVAPIAEPRLESNFGAEFPVLAYLDAALDAAGEHELADVAVAFRRLSDKIRWSQNPGYDVSNVGKTLLDGYAYAGLSGPDCPVLCEAPRCGFLLMAPGVTYTDHRHGPREVYLVLTPGAEWRLDSGKWFDVHPGDLIIHEPWQMHAMRTRNTPLFAFVAWLEKGDRNEIAIQCDRRA